MTKDNYREKVEEHRQEIELNNGSTPKLSRANRHQKKSKKKRSNPIMTILVVVLIFIPLSILAYVSFIYEPNAAKDDKAAVADNKDNLVVEIQKQDPNTSKSVTDDEDEKAQEDDTAADEKAKAEEEAKKAEEEKARIAAEEAKKIEDKMAKEKAAKDAAEVKKAEEAQKAAAQKAQEQAEKKKDEQPVATGQNQTHTVQATDNLYRIAIKYYGSGSAANIEKIKAANNLTSDSISAGQVLIITP